VADHVQVVAAMDGMTESVSRQVRAQSQQSIQAEAVRRDHLVACLVQPVTAQCPLADRVALVLPPVVCERVCLSDRVKLAVPHLRLGPLDPRHLLRAGFHPRAPRHESAEERSSGSQS
jgi:hypothetical protein